MNNLAGEDVDLYARMKSRYVYSMHSIFHRLGYQLPFRRNRQDRAIPDEISKMIGANKKKTGGVDVFDQIRVLRLEPDIDLDENFTFLRPSNS